MYLPLRWYRNALLNTSVEQGILHSTSVVQSIYEVQEGHTCSSLSVVKREDVIMMEESYLMDYASRGGMNIPPKSNSKGRPKK